MSPFYNNSEPYSNTASNTGDVNGVAIIDETTIHIIIIIASMCIAVCIALCCGFNRGYAELDNYEDAKTAMQEFRRDIMEKKILVVTVPKGYIPCCCSRNAVFGVDEYKYAWEKKSYALFYSTRIKRRWKPLATYIQFLFGWITFASTIVALILPTNIINNVIGGCALFLNELLLHMWYGYLRYPNVTWAGLDIDGKGDGLFENMRNLFSILYHNGSDDDHWNPWIDWICFPFIAVLHVASFVGLVASLCLCCCFDALGQQEDEREKRRRLRRRKRRGFDDSEKDPKGTIAFAAMVGALLGSFAYPLLFTFTTHPIWKVIASLAHKIVEEYYEARLFRRSMKEFLITTVFSFFSDFVGIDGLEHLTEELDDELEQFGLDFEQANEAVDAVEECVEDLPDPDATPAPCSDDEDSDEWESEEEEEEYFDDEEFFDTDDDDDDNGQNELNDGLGRDAERFTSVNDDKSDESFDSSDDDEETDFFDSEEEIEEGNKKQNIRTNEVGQKQQQKQAVRSKKTRRRK